MVVYSRIARKLPLVNGPHRLHFERVASIGAGGPRKSRPALFLAPGTRIPDAAIRSSFEYVACNVYDLYKDICDIFEDREACQVVCDEDRDESSDEDRDVYIYVHMHVQAARA